MTELTQLFTIGEHGRGDCWRTAFACVLDKQKPEDVLDFVYSEDGTLNDDWFADTQEWLLIQGLVLESVGLGQRIEGHEMAPGITERLRIETYVVDGLSPRVRPDGSPIYHACVAHNRKVIYDPHPERKGLAGEPMTAWLLTPIINK
jgi:hypothetical protein